MSDQKKLTHEDRIAIVAELKKARENSTKEERDAIFDKIVEEGGFGKKLSGRELSEALGIPVLITEDDLKNPNSSSPTCDGHATDYKEVGKMMEELPSVKEDLSSIIENIEHESISDSLEYDASIDAAIKDARTKPVNFECPPRYTWKDCPKNSNKKEEK